MNKIVPRVCVIGAGKWGLNHIKTLMELDALSGIVDKNENINKIKAKFNCEVFSDLECVPLIILMDL